MRLEAALFFAGAMIFTYIGYPALAFGLSKVMRRRVRRAPLWPSISIILPVHNESDRIEGRLKNILAQGYPRALAEIIVVDDGSDEDAAKSIPADLLSRVKLITLPRRRGKASALNAGVQAASGEILVFMDARQRIKPGSLEALLENFHDQRVTAVTGSLECPSPGAEGALRRYEEALRRWESAWASPAGATGALYAVRRGSAVHLREDTILDDFVMSMSAAATGRLVHERRAVAMEVDEGRGDAWRRRMRTLAGNWQIVFHPLRFRRMFSAGTVVQLVCHKLLRLLFPLFAMGLVASVAIAAPPVALALVGVGAAAGVLLVSGRGRLGRTCAVAVASLIAAPLAGLAGYISGRETVLWARR